MVIDQFLTSLANYLWESGKRINENLKVCFHEMPQDSKLPVIYFPNPSVISSNDTLSGFVLNYSWYVKVFATSMEEAYAIASGIQRQLSFDKFKVPVLNKNGTHAGFKIKINNPEIKALDAHSYQITINWNERNHYDAPSLQTIDKVDMVVTSKQSIPFDVLLDNNNCILTDESRKFILIETGG